LLIVFVVQVSGILMLLISLPGTWVILASVVLYALITGFGVVGWKLITLLLVLAILGEVLEFVASAVGAQRYGASTGGSVCAIIGVLPGAIIGSALVPVIGTVVGALAGAFAGAYFYELSRKRAPDEALRAGWGALLGRSGSIVLKVVIAFAMSGAFIVALLTPAAA